MSVKALGIQSISVFFITLFVSHKAQKVVIIKHFVEKSSETKIYLTLIGLLMFLVKDLKKF
jgi:hypothetical protein